MTNAIVPVPLQLQHILPQQEYAVRHKDDPRSPLHDLERFVLSLSQVGTALQSFRRVRANARRRTCEGTRASPESRGHETLDLVHSGSLRDSYEMPQTVIQE